MTTHYRNKLSKIILWVARAITAAVFLVGGVPKLFDFEKFASVISAYGILPEVLVLPTAVMLPIVEVVTGIGVLLGRKWAVYSALSMMLLFIGVLSYGVFLGLDIDCGCFDIGDPEHQAFSGLRSAIIRDAFFMVPILYMLTVKKKY